MGGILHDWFADYITLRSQKVVINGVCSDLLNVTSGVPQGSILGPFLFVLYINDLPECIQKPTDIALFADDSKVSQIIGSANDGVNLQCNLNRLHSWSSEWHMDLNIIKCKTMRITRNKTPKLETDYFIDNNLLKCVTSIRGLGINVTSDLKWSTHISEITSKTNRTLGLVKRTSVDIKDFETRRLLYCTLVRPLLEYGSELWSPYEKKYIALIEDVQRRATKFILNYQKATDYKSIMIMLDLLPLEFRRQMKDLIFLFKLKNGLYNLDFEEYARSVQAKRQSGYNLRTSHQDNFSELRYRANYFCYSYFPRVIRSWNDLPSTLKTIKTISTFKTALKKLYSLRLGDCSNF